MKPMEHYTRKLQGRLDQLRGRLEQIDSELEEPVSKDWEEQATEREGDEVKESLGAAGLTEIRAIEAALDRIDAGSFGICAKCGDEISEERLDAVPHAALCRFCASGQPR
jgi:RNA polymerase-binding transcription factor DksA